MPDNRDIQFLTHALHIAAQGLGRTMPNPTVGCVLVKDGVVIAQARTADGGRPHAEALALNAAGNEARGATAYVTLEPCSHHGKTPPCSQALIDAGIARVVYGCEDPDPRVSGQGAAMLRAAGITVEKIEMPEAARLNRGFFRRVQHGLPHVAMKLATSADGYMAYGDGKRQPITGELARAHGHRLRGEYDCIITGINTVLLDDPEMNVRAPYAPHPNLVRVVCDRKLRLPLNSKLVKTANQQPVWVITSAEAVELAASHATELREAGVVFLVLENGATGCVPPPLGGRLGGGRNEATNVPYSAPPQPSPYVGGGAPSQTSNTTISTEEISASDVLRTLAAEGITRVLIESGSQLSAAFLEAGLVETLHWYRAPIMLGNTGKTAINALDSLLTPRHAPAESRMLGVDTYERYELN